MASEHEIPYTKVLRPTLQEFSNFEEFVEGFDQDKTCQNYGMLKIVPPAKWKPRKENVTSVFHELTVSSPIEQNAQGHSGIYELLLMQKKSMKLNDYRKKVEPFDNITEGKSVEEVEDLFWKNLAFSPPLYGADIGGTTLFDDGVAWNLNDLPGILKEGLENPIAGVNNPYLYIGAWKTLFGWHKEDMDLYAVNFNHYGKPKLWYCLPPSENKKLEEFAKSQFPDSFKKCKEFIRHKTVMMNPYVLKQKIPDLKIHKAIQYPGEFIVTYGGAYHAGFNWGFNIAEAVNFATTRWLKILPNVDSCKCRQDSVKIQYKEFFKVLLEKTRYGQMPSVKKTLAEYGIHARKGDEIEEEEEEKEERTSSRRQRESLRSKTPAKRSRSRGMAIEEEKVEEVVPKTTTARKPKTKIELAKIKLKSTKKREEKESSLLSQSKKIKKIDDDYLVTDWRGLRKGKRGDVEVTRTRTERNTRSKDVEEHDDVKQLLKTQKLEELVFENWVQCDKCNKWRIIRGKSGSEVDKLLQKKKLECSNIPGRDCSQPEDKQSKDSYILPKNQYVKSVYAM